MKPFVITSALTAAQLNKHWQRHLPFLKLQFYTTDNRAIRGHDREIPLDKISQKVKGPKWLVIYPGITVNTFEKLFQTTFGLRVEVLRKAGYTWDDTDYFKNQTLIQQNTKSEIRSSVYQTEY